uniref:Uncharacterized protein n=1 Tax=Sphaerodactylus townsendi TaxID=933632 RepID=A0ACB8F724_9SAUR
MNSLPPFIGGKRTHLKRVKLEINTLRGTRRHQQRGFESPQAHSRQPPVPFRVGRSRGSPSLAREKAARGGALRLTRQQGLRSGRQSRRRFFVGGLVEIRYGCRRWEGRPPLWPSGSPHGLRAAKEEARHGETQRRAEGVAEVAAVSGARQFAPCLAPEAGAELAIPPQKVDQKFSGVVSSFDDGKSWIHQWLLKRSTTKCRRLPPAIKLYLITVSDEVEESIEEMLIRLDEFYGMTDMISTV